VKIKHKDIQNYNFTSCFVWVWNLVADIEGERRLRVFENRVLRRIFGSKRDELTGEWRELHNEEPHDLYSTRYSAGDKIEKNELGGACSAYGVWRGVYRVLVGKPEGKRLLWRYGR
jgi:PAS domain-containing protein